MEVVNTINGFLNSLNDLSKSVRSMLAIDIWMTYNPIEKLDKIRKEFYYKLKETNIYKNWIRTINRALIKAVKILKQLRSQTGDVFLEQEDAVEHIRLIKSTLNSIIVFLKGVVEQWENEKVS